MVRLTAYRFPGLPTMPLVPAPSARTWMDGTSEGFARRCLPLLIANQAGWHILLPYPIVACWNGEPSLTGITITGPEVSMATSHFGHGVLTFSIPYLFRTDPGWNLWVRGPANLPLRHAHPLEGIVETDWNPATFTMNWQLTAPHVPVTFPAGFPIVCVLPQRRGELEAVEPDVQVLEPGTGLANDFTAWSDARAQFLIDSKVPGSEAAKEGWQRDYFQGRDARGNSVPGHQTRLRLKPFRQ